MFKSKKENSLFGDMVKTVQEMTKRYNELQKLPFKVGDIVWYDDKITREFYQVKIIGTGDVYASVRMTNDGKPFNVLVSDLHKNPNLEKYKPF